MGALLEPLDDLVGHDALMSWLYGSSIECEVKVDDIQELMYALYVLYAMNVIHGLNDDHLHN